MQKFMNRMRSEAGQFEPWFSMVVGFILLLILIVVAFKLLDHV